MCKYLHRIPRLMFVLPVLLVFCTAGSAQAGFDHPCMLLNQQEIDAVKVKIAASASPWQAAYTNVIGKANTALAAGIPTVMSGPTPPTSGDSHVYYTGDGYGGERTDCVSSTNARNNMMALATAYAFSGNTAYADKVVDYIRAWFVNASTKMRADLYEGEIREDGSVSGQPALDISITFPGMFYAVDLIWNYSGFTAADKTAVQDWAHTMAYYKYRMWPGYAACGNNWSDWKRAMATACAVIAEDQTELTNAFEQWKLSVDCRILSNPLGAYNSELTRAYGVSYTCFANNACTFTAEVARHHGEDLYGYTVNAKSIEKGLDFLAWYAADPTTWTWDGGKSDTWNGSADGAGLFELAYLYEQKQAYLDVVNRWGRPMLQPWNMGYTTLTHAYGAYTWQVWSESGTPTVSTPSFSPSPGTYSTSQSVSISTVPSDATILYTTDGSTPNTGSTVYTGPITISSTTTLKAMAVKVDYNDSAVASGVYAIGSGNTSSTTWQTFSVSNRVGAFEAEFDAVPNVADINALTGICLGTADEYDDLACIVRFYNNQIDARNGDSYASDTTVSYSSGTSYHFRLVISVPDHTYSVYVTPEGSSEITLATDYAFRTAQASVTALDGWAIYAFSGSHTVDNMTFTDANTPPVADAGPDQTVSDSDDSGAENVTLDGSGSSDSDGTIGSYVWEENSSQIATGVGPTVTLSVAVHTIDLTVTDDDSATDTDSVTITVNAAPAAGGDALLVVGNLSLNDGDTAVKNTLEAMGYTVTTVDDNVCTTADSNGMDLVITSSTTSSGYVSDKYRDIAIPVINWEQAVQDDYEMVDPGVGTDRGTEESQTQVAIVDSGHDLAAGLSGTVTVYTSAQTISWGRPNGNAATVATLTGDATKVVIYGYDTGAAMFAGLNAPARRVHTFLENSGAAYLTADGQALLEAAINWATDTAPPANSPPVADAGPDQNVTDSDENGSEDVTLDGSGSSDSDGTISSYVWEENSSQIATGSGPTVSFDVGSHTVVLTVTDDDDATDTDSVAITVNAAPAGETSSTTWQTFAATNQTGTFEAEFDAVPNVTDVNGVTGMCLGTADEYNDLACIVRFYSGQIEARNGDSYASDTTVTYSSGTSYHFRLVISVPDHVYSVYVTPDGQSEVPLASDYAFRTAQGTVTALDGWAIYAFSGSHTVSDMAFTGANTPPVADAGQDQTVTDDDDDGSEEATLDAYGSYDLDGTISSYVWEEDSSQIATGVAPSVDFDVGTHTVVLTVTDDDSDTDTDSVVITVNAHFNVAPVADAGPDQTVGDSDDNGAENVTLDGSGSSDSDGTISSYVWKEDSSQIATGSGPTVSFDVGSHTVVLTVTDDDGDTDTDSVSITVTAYVNLAPTADAGPNQTVTDSDDSGDEDVTLDGSGSSDSDGTIASYVWEENSSQIATGSGPTVSFDVGSHTVVLTVTDDDSAADTDTVTITVSASTTTINDGLVAYWPFEEGAGSTVEDYSGNNNDGTIDGATRTTSGKEGDALDFDGSNDRVDCGTFNVTGSAITIAAWFNADSWYGSYYDGRLVSKATGTAETDHTWMLSTIKSGGYARLRFRLKTGGTTTTLIASSGNLSTSTWRHAVAWYNGSTMKLYLDGDEVGSASKSGSITTSSAGVAVGNNPDGADTVPWDGRIDEVRIYDRALTTAEIDELVAGAPAANQPPTADAGPDQNADDNDDSGAENVTLDGSDSSDSDGTIVSYVWTENSSQIATGSGPTVSFDVGSHTVVLTVTDDDDDTDTDSVSITVNAYVNQAPTADAGSDQTVTDHDDGGDEDVTLDGSGSSDSDGTIVSYVWEENSSQIATGSGPTVSFDVGSHTVVLTVTDDDSATDTDSVSITVNAAPSGETSSTTWQTFSVSTQTGAFEAEFDAVPNMADMNGVTGICLGTADEYDDLACIVRFYNGQIEARNGDSYASDTGVAHSTGVSYHFRFVIHIPDHTYSVYVTPSGQPEVTLATDYAFRTPQQSVTSLNGWAIYAFDGSHTVSNMTFDAIGFAPTADAGPDQTVTDNDESGSESVTLDGSGSSDDGTIVSYVWEENSSQIATGVGPTVSFSVATHTVVLTVTDDDSETDTDSVVITVNAYQNVAPVADAGSDQTVTDTDDSGAENVTLDGSGSSDPGGTIVSYVWEEESTQIATGSGPTVSFNVGVHTIVLTVTDDDSATDTDSVVITVNPAANLDPVADAGPDQIVTDTDDSGAENVTLDGSGSTDADGTISSYVWEEDSSQIATGAQPTASFTVGSHTVVLTVTDDDSATDTDSVVITVNAATNQPPVADAGSDQTVMDSDDSGSENVTLDGSGSTDADGTISSYVWEEDSSQIATGSGPTVSFAVGTHYVVLTVTDDDSATDTDSVIITVNEPSTGGNVYYVDENHDQASDSNPGTAALPWLTSAKAASTAVAGDTVIFKSGTYSGFTVANSGSAGNPITFEVASGHTVTVPTITMITKSHITIRGFRVIGFTLYGVNIDVNCSNITVENLYCEPAYRVMNKCIRIGESGSNFIIRNNHCSMSGDGININRGSFSNILIEDNTLIYDAASRHPDEHPDGIVIGRANYDGVIIRNNYIEDATSANIYFPGTQHDQPYLYENIEIYGNVLVDIISDGKGIHLTMDTRELTTYYHNVDIHSNSILNFNAAIKMAGFLFNDKGGQDVAPYVSNVTLRNNIFYNCNFSRGSFLDSDYNLLYKDPTQAGTLITAYVPSLGKLKWYNSLAAFHVDLPNLEVHSVGSDPQLTTNGYVPGGSSPVIDAGDPSLGTIFSLPSSFTDLEGTTRPQGTTYDIGAVEVD